ncbi:MAG: hypothetical protein NWF00_10035 [Candidatus Bathyarchaeota archaeon]|nr:hypothetical protein [Candidatus Bathyarchaeota archaeon]
MRTYRGITGYIRRAINNNTLKGRITTNDVRRLLPDRLYDAPNSTIIASLRNMAKNREIVIDKNGNFFTKGCEPACRNKEVTVTGYVTEAKEVGGKVFVTIEVTHMKQTKEGV